MPKVSVFLTTYNWPKALALCVHSLWKQSVLPDEIIIADDGSGNETRLVIEELKKDSPVPLVHVWQEDNGYRINHIRNKAIAAASHPYIIQLDGDIILHEDFIKDHLAFSSKGRFVVGRRNDLTSQFTQQLLSDAEVVQYPKIFRSKIVAILHRLLLGNKNSVKGVRGCNIAFWKEDAYAINGYDEDMESKGPNDKEFAARLVNLGIHAYDLKFYACCYHLFHGEEGLRTNHQLVKSILLKTIESKKIKCVNGLQKE